MGEHLRPAGIPADELPHGFVQRLFIFHEGGEVWLERLAVLRQYPGRRLQRSPLPGWRYNLFKRFNQLTLQTAAFSLFQQADSGAGVFHGSLFNPLPVKRLPFLIFSRLLIRSRLVGGFVFRLFGRRFTSGLLLWQLPGRLSIPFFLLLQHRLVCLDLVCLRKHRHTVRMRFAAVMNSPVFVHPFVDLSD